MLGAATVPQSTMARVARAIAWRSAWVTAMNVYRAFPRMTAPATPASFVPVRIRGTGPNDAERARSAMRAANDDVDGVGARLAQGDELFGWQAADGAVACFCWVRYRGRAIGPVALRDHPGRVFFYNAQTLPQYRGRGLYRVLLEHMQSTLTQEQHTEFIGDCDRANEGSRRGIEGADFKLIATITMVRLLRRWDRQLRRTMIDPSMAGLF
jgi:hypothetical protein